MTIKKFLLISLVAHIVILGAVYFLPAPQVKKAKELMTRLVSPEEVMKPKVVPLPKIKPVPKPIPALPKPIKPPSRSIKIPPRSPFTPDKPVVPGEGKEYGKPLPEGVTPKPGKADTAAPGREKSDGKDKEALQEDPSKPGYQEGHKPSGRPGLSAREKLFDTGVIGETAKKEPSSKGTGKKGDTITFDTKDYRFAGYMKKLRDKIESIWEYPVEAAKKGIYGDLRIRFTIKKNGTLGAIELVRTSGYKSLDDAAIKALREGEPYWPLPDEWGMESYEILGHFIYTMYGYGLR